MYEHLVTSEEGMPVLHPENTAHALRETARALRDAHPDQPERWAAIRLRGLTLTGETGPAGKHRDDAVRQMLCRRPDEHGTLEG